MLLPRSRAESACRAEPRSHCAALCLLCWVEGSAGKLHLASRTTPDVDVSYIVDASMLSLLTETPQAIMPAAASRLPCT